MKHARRLGPLLLLSLLSCGSPTQIVLSIDTTLGAPCQIDRVEVVAMGSQETMVASEILVGRLPLTVALTQDGGPRDFQLEVRGFRGDSLRYVAAADLRFESNSLLGLHVVLDEDCTVGSPCTYGRGQLTDFMMEPDPVERTDCAGRVVVNRYELRQDSFEEHHNACTDAVSFVGRVLEGEENRLVTLFGDGDSRAGELSDFDFRFYGELVRRIEISSEGFIQFGDDRANLRGVESRGLDTANVPRPGIAAFWDDLRARDGVCFAMTGARPNRRLWITWANTCLGTSCRPVDDLNFSIALDEGTDEILITYGEMVASSPDRANGLSAVAGLSNAPAMCGAAECGADGLCDSGEPCGYTQAFAEEAQLLPYPSYRFTPVLD